MLEMRQATIHRFLELLKIHQIECHAISVCQNDQVLLQEAFDPYQIQKLHPVYSITKSFTSMAVGFLEAEGKLTLDEPWISYFPEYGLDVIDPKFHQVTIKHLLTMSLGQDVEAEIVAHDDWVKTILGKKIIYEPGTTFLYNSHCSHLLSALVSKLTKQKMSEYLRPRLFEPLGFGEYYWQEDLQGLSIGGYGLHLCIDDLMRFGNCCLNQGIYQGKQILPKTWIEKATTYQIRNADGYPLDRSENRQGYGLHFWMCTQNGYRMSGLHGQLCFIQPENRLVVAMFNNTSGSQAVLDCLFQAMEEQPKAILKPEFQILPLQGSGKDQVINSWLHDEIPASKNDFHFNWVKFEKAYDTFIIQIKRDNQVYKVKAKMNHWCAQENDFHTFNTFLTYDCIQNEQPDEIDNTLFCSYAWSTSSTLLVEIREYDHSAVTNLRFAFDQSHIVLYYSVSGLYTNVIETKCVFKRL